MKDMPVWWKRFGCQPWQDWAGVLFPSRHNWSDFTLIHASAECEWCLGNSEIHVALLGVHVRLTYYWPHEGRDTMLAEAEAMFANMKSSDADSDHAGDLGTSESPTSADGIVRSHQEFQS